MKLAQMRNVWSISLQNWVALWVNVGKYTIHLPSRYVSYNYYEVFVGI